MRGLMPDTHIYMVRYFGLSCFVLSGLACEQYQWVGWAFASKEGVSQHCNTLQNMDHWQKI